MNKNILGLLVLSLFVLPTSAFAMSWTEQTNSGAHYWNSIASSADGSKLISAHGGTGGYIYTSTDSGVTWTAQTGSGVQYWQAVASSADGSKLVAVGHPGYIYTSTNSGVTWTQRTSAGNRAWTGIVSSSDGTKLAATDYFGYIYTSTDSGVTWTAQTSAGVHNWISIASSSDGTKLAALGQNDTIYTSTDSGATWTAQTSAGTRNWTSITSSADGSKLAATVFGNKIYTSADSGATWTARDSNRGWYSITSSSDGTKLAATHNNGYIYTSTDSGVTWVQETEAGYNVWLGITSSADGSRLAVGGDLINIYTGIVPEPIDIFPPTVTNVTSTVTNGTYGTGKTITTLVQFSEPVTVTGTAQITLETGATDKIANYVSGSGTDTLIFSSVTTTGDTTNDLDYTSTTALSGNIKDLANNTANLTLVTPGATNSLSHNKDIAIDTIAPNINMSLITPANVTILPTNVVSVTGSAGAIEGATTISITSEAKTLCTTNVNADGSFTCNFTALAGKKMYTIRALDLASNISKKPYTLAYYGQ